MYKMQYFPERCLLFKFSGAKNASYFIELKIAELLAV